MPASHNDLSRWFDEGVAEGATHMVVKCDSFGFRGDPRDNCCYPIFVKPDEDVRKVAHENGDRLMEVYDLRKSKDEQVFQTTQRVFNY